MATSKTWRQASYGRLIFWIIAAPITYFMGLWDSVSFVTFLSFYAIWTGEFSSARADAPVDE